MRNLVIFMVLVGVFVVGKRALNFNRSIFSLETGIEGTGATETATRTVTGYHYIANNTSADVEWREGDSWNIEISGQPNIIAALETEVDGDWLNIGFKQSVRNVNDLHIRVTSPQLHGVKVAGSGNFMANSKILAEEFSMSIAGSGDIKLNDIACERLASNIAGSGNILVSSGSTGSLDINIAGSGDAKMNDLLADKVKANVAGSGNISCRANSTLDASVIGSGDIYYTGNPELHTSIIGSGAVHQR